MASVVEEDSVKTSFVIVEREALDKARALAQDIPNALQQACDVDFSMPAIILCVRPYHRRACETLKDLPSTVRLRRSR